MNPTFGTPIFGKSNPQSIQAPLFRTQNSFGPQIISPYSSTNEQKSKINEQESKINEQLKEINDSLKELLIISKIPQPIQNFHFSQPTEKPKSKTQASILMRKSIIGKELPPYIINGNGTCDKCFITELLHGFHYGESTDLCTNCFNISSIINKENWIEFSI
jgi:hypothetical protein